MLFNCDVGEDSLRVPWTARRFNQSILGEISLGVHWKDWCWSWNSNTLATTCEELTHWKRPWYWERLRAGGEGDSRGWDGWMASPTQWPWVWVESGSWWWTGRPGVLWFMGSQGTGQDWEIELNWIRYNMGKIWLHHSYYYTLNKIKYSWIMDLILKCKAVKFLKENRIFLWLGEDSEISYIGQNKNYPIGKYW